MTAFGQRPRQKTVLGNKTRQCGKPVEAGVGTGEQDRRAGRLDQEVQDVADQPLAENRAGDLRQHRRVFIQIRGGVGDEGQPGHPGQQKPEDDGHHGQHPTGVVALRRTKDVDGVGNRLDPGQRRATVGERAQHHQHRGTHHQAAALMDRYRSDNVRRVVFR